MTADPARTLIELVDGDHWLTHGVIDDEARHVFMHGYCGDLALALHDYMGWPIIGAGAWDDDAIIVEGGSMIVEGVGAHYGTQAPDGRVVDIEGAHEIHAWAGRWGVDRAFAVVDPDTLWSPRYIRDRATATFIRPLLDSVGVPAPCVHGRTGPPAPVT